LGKSFAFGFYPSATTASPSSLSRMMWRIKRYKRKIYHHHNFGDYLSFLVVKSLYDSRVSLAVSMKKESF